MKIAVIKYNAGNIQSVSFALQRLGVDHVITDDPITIQSSDKVIFPGVGEASTTMAFLKNKNLDVVIRNLKQPVLGICLGMQLLCKHSEENNTECLGVFEQNVLRFKPGKDLKVPHIGWNKLIKLSGWAPAESENSYAYFVHSYYVPVNSNTTAQCFHGESFSAAMGKNNFYAVQFHPEKSAGAGEMILKSFLAS